MAIKLSEELFKTYLHLNCSETVVVKVFNAGVCDACKDLVNQISSHISIAPEIILGM